MTQKLRIVYNDSDKTIIGFLLEEFDHKDHEARSPEGVKVTDNYLEFDDDVIAVSYTHLTLPTTPYV